MWHSDSSGYCPGCVLVWYLGVDSVGQVGCFVFGGGTFVGPRISARVLSGGSDSLLRRSDGAMQPDVRLTVQTDDGAVILFHLTGYGWPDESRIAATLKHVCSDERYAWLSRTLCVVTGELRGREVVLDVAELVWEPLT